MSFFGETDSISNEIKKLHREIDTLRNKSEFQPILTTGRSDDGYGAGVGSKTMNSGGVWALTPVVHSVNKLTSGATTYDMIELASACITVDRNTAQSTSITQFDVKTIRMGSTNETGATITNSAPNGAILFIKPIRGKQITLKTGGNIYISQDITLDDKAFAILQFYVDATGTGASESNKKWVMLTGSGGSGSINSIKEPCRVATTGNNALHPVYNVTIDGVTLIEGQRLLVKNQTTARDNGIYVCGVVVSGGSTFTRATDFDNDSEVKSGTLVTINEGTANGNKVYMMTEDTDPIIVGTTNIYFTLVTAVDTSANFVWTGVHKFQNALTELGVGGTDVIKVIGEINGVGPWTNMQNPDGSGNNDYTIPNSSAGMNIDTSIIMNTNNIYDVDQILFARGTSSLTPSWEDDHIGFEFTQASNGTDTGLGYHVANNNSTTQYHRFFVNAHYDDEEELRIGADGIKFGTNTTPTGNGSIFFDGTNLKVLTGGATINLTNATGGVQLADNPTWTGNHVFSGQAKFQRNPTGSLGSGSETHTVEFGNTGTDRIMVIGEMTGPVPTSIGNGFVITDPAYNGTDTANNTLNLGYSPTFGIKSNIDMNTYNIYDLDQLIFGHATSTLTPTWVNDHIGIEIAQYTNPQESYGLAYNVPNQYRHSFQSGYGTAGSSTMNEICRMYKSGNSSGDPNVLEFGGSSSEIIMLENSVVRAYTDDFIGFHVTDNTGAGSKGTMEIPYLVDTTEYSEANTSALNTAFGSDNGSIGVQYDNGGTDVLWFRANSVWRKASGGGGSTSFSGFSADANLNMNGRDITSIDNLEFDPSQSLSLSGSDYGIEASTGIGLEYNVPSLKFHHFTVNGTSEFAISENTISVYDKRITNLADPTADQDAVTRAWHNANGVSGWNGNATGNLDMNNNTINELNNISFNTTGQDIYSSTSGLQFTVPTGDSFSWQINSQTRLYITDASNTFYKYLNMSSQKIINLATPILDYDASTKKYVDDEIAGVSGGSGADTNLSNLTTTGEGHFDSRYGKKEGGNSVTIQANWTFAGTSGSPVACKLGAIASRSIEVKSKLKFTGNTTTYFLTTHPAVLGYITIKIGSTDFKLWYGG